MKLKLKEKIVLNQIQQNSIVNYNLNFEIKQKIDLNNLKKWFKEVLNIHILEKIDDKNSQTLAQINDILSSKVQNNLDKFNA